MGTIVCRHKNHTIFGRLSDNYGEFHSIVIVDGKAHSIVLKSSHFHAELEHDDNNKQTFMRWYQAKSPGMESPHRVLKDVRINDDTFISLDGYICNLNDYKKTKETLDVTELLGDISSQQPKMGHKMSHGNKKDIKHKIIHFDEIPTVACFNTYQGRDWDIGVMHRRVGKYWMESVKSRNIEECHLRGQMCPFVDEGFYININFHEEDSIWYNPGKKFVQLNHAVTHENFFDRDGYLCSVLNYQYVSKEEVELYYKKFLFLV